MPDSIVFVGTSHLDPRGRRRLSSMLGLLSPDIVAVEIDSAHIDNIAWTEEDISDKTTAMLLKYPGSHYATVDWIARNYAYEYRVSKEHCVSNGSDLYCIDDSMEDNPAAPQIDTGRLLAMPLDRLLASGASKYGDNVNIDSKHLSWLQARDDVMESRIRDMPGRVLFVGGAGHVFADYGNLYDRFADSDVARYSLNMVGSPNWMKRVEGALPLKW